MSALLGLVTANWQAVAGIFAAIAGALGLYLKGRSDAASKAKLEDITNAERIRKAGADARDRARSGSVSDNDGFRRD